MKNTLGWVASFGCFLGGLVRVGEKGSNPKVEIPIFRAILFNVLVTHFDEDLIPDPQRTNFSQLFSPYVISSP